MNETKQNVEIKSSFWNFIALVRNPLTIAVAAAAVAKGEGALAFLFTFLAALDYSINSSRNSKE